MSNPGQADPTPITAARQLAEWFAAGCKPKSDWRIGTEHEKFGFRRSDFSSPDYEHRGIGAMLSGIMAKGWAPIRDGENIIGLTQGAASVSLEPGGQFELSGGPMEDLHAARLELAAHLRDVHEVAGPLGLGFAGMGFHPAARREDMSWMPKSRYAIMREYMPKRGSMGLDMMLRTSTVQVNLDFGDEADMVEKLRVSLALQPLATALFASSPLREGQPSGYKSLRGHVWSDTDPDRTGIPGLVFEEGFGFERFAEFVLDVPMYFVARDGKLLDATGQSFRRFMAGGLPSLPGIEATMGDVADHVTTVFTEVRLKKFLEMRGSDAGSAAMIQAQPAFWVGLIYDDAAQKAARALTRDWTVAQMHALRADAPRLALEATIAGRPLRDVARDALAISEAGLKARGLGEEIYLAPLHEIVESGMTQADRILQMFHGPWRGDARLALPFTEL
ncbi:glutamate--cysteine ligase [Sediminicoccus sp. KRV36]|uniref:glutamate--cysteine ligase n=1 Tax=Sediminicoccus sp. KRV36 TaxID=3133721 RepID=UPI0020109431|nr:glutamate--cysteine ligase [Sediminicoccus rosea]UPY34958.1 glutamate--cysteine ligase [Sediminicoccus rosea]